MDRGMSMMVSEEATSIAAEPLAKWSSLRYIPSGLGGITSLVMDSWRCKEKWSIMIKIATVPTAQYANPQRLYP